jgi:CDP-glucose 4,6-dehydratase
MTSIAGKKILVTGASGFLGPAVCETLLEEGAVVCALDRVHKPTSRIHELTASLNLITADVRDFQKLQDLIKKERFEFIFHLAAQALVGDAVRDPASTFQDNILGTWNTLEAARQAGREWPEFGGVIVASSDKAYGDQDELPYLESAPMQGRYPYDVSKSCADLLARSYFASYRLPVCVVRSGNLYGPGDLNLSRIVPGTIVSLLAGQRPMIRSDGSPVRDYIFVKDAAAAYTALAGAMLKDRSLHGEAFNISDDKPLSVLELVNMIRKLMNCEELEPVIENTASLEIQKQYLSSQKIRQRLGWSPRYTLEKGLTESIAWYKSSYSLASK